MTRRDFVKPAFPLRKKRSVKTHALSLLGTTRLLSRSACAILDRCVKTLGRDVAEWLAHPSPHAVLGDL